MYIPHGGQRGRDRGPTDAPKAGEATAVAHVACGLLGLVAVSLLVLAAYPLLIAVTRPLQILSSTAITLVFVSVWVLVWLGIEIVWEWRTGRVSLSE